MTTRATTFTIDARCALNGNSMTFEKSIIQALEVALQKIVIHLLAKHFVKPSDAREIRSGIQTYYADGCVGVALPASFTSVVKATEIDRLKAELCAALHGESTNATPPRPAQPLPQHGGEEPRGANGVPDRYTKKGTGTDEPGVQGTAARTFHLPVQDPAVADESSDVASRQQLRQPRTRPPSGCPAQESFAEQTGEQSQRTPAIAGTETSAETNRPGARRNGHIGPPSLAPGDAIPVASEITQSPVPLELPSSPGSRAPVPLELKNTQAPEYTEQRIFVARLRHATLATMRGRKQRFVLLPDNCNGAAVHVGENLTGKLLGLRPHSGGLWILRAYKIDPSPSRNATAENESGAVTGLAQTQGPSNAA